jgi:hypothetical protein
MNGDAKGKSKMNGDAKGKSKMNGDAKEIRKFGKCHAISWYSPIKLH